MTSSTAPTTSLPPLSEPLIKTNAALFDLWFPVDCLQIPAKALPDIKAKLADVIGTFVAQAPYSTSVLYVLNGLTYPGAESLPYFYAYLVASENPAVQRFLATEGGFGNIDRETASAVLAVFFTGFDDQGEKDPNREKASAQSALTAMLCRQIYLSTIWDLPLAVPLTGIQDPATFVSDTETYAKLNYPAIPPSWLVFDRETATIKAKDGVLDYLVIGSGPAGATMASELRAGGKRVVLIEQGPFVVWGSMDTMSYSRLMFQNNIAATDNNAILVRSGQAMGGGTTVNIDLAFSPLEATIQYRIGKWMDEERIDPQFYTQDRLAKAYRWVRNAIRTREVTQSELNRDNRALWRGANKFGVNPDLYHLNRFPETLSPSPVTQKRDAARQLILPAMQEVDNPLAVIPDVAVVELLFAPVDGERGAVRCTGARLVAQKPWTEKGNTIVDPCGLALEPGQDVTIAATEVILSAGTIGSAKILLETAKSVPAVANPHVGCGLIMHPSFPLLGTFKQRINLLEGLDSATFLEAFGVTPGFIFETMSGLPAYGALLIPGSGEQVYDRISKFNHTAGFGVMLVDESCDENRVFLDDTGTPVLTYALTESDKARFRIGIAVAIRMMFLAGAETVIIPTNENVLGEPDFDPMVGVVLTHPDQADLVEKNLQFLPNRTLLTSAHLQATNKLGTPEQKGVASNRQRVWNWVTKQEIPNLYLMDSSMFPTSVGANPMQSLYTFAKIFSERLLKGMDHPAPLAEADAGSDAPVRGPANQPGLAAAE